MRVVHSLAIFDVDDTLCPDGGWEPYPLAKLALRELAEAGVICAVASNAGYWVERVGAVAAVQRVITVAEACGIPRERTRVCTHLKPEGCACRKPAPGMLEDLIRCYASPLSRWQRSLWMVGDRWADVAAGVGASCSTILVGLANYPYPQKGTTPLPPDTPDPDFVVRDIMHTAKLIAGISSL